jgi:hypothetical protein
MHKQDNDEKKHCSCSAKGERENLDICHHILRWNV